MGPQAAQNLIRTTKKSFRWDRFKHKYLELKLKSFSPKISFSFDFKDYTIKTVENTDELREVLKLRYDIFTKTYGVQMKFHEIDFDRLDLLGDHIILKTRSSGKIIGTYRMICSKFSNEFYSDGEFQIDKFKSIPGTKVELGRACIHEDYRTGASISLVWRGLSKYIVLSDADYLFGCTSVSTTSPEIAFRVLKRCQKEYQNNKYEIEPTRKYRYPKLTSLHLVDKEVDVDKYIPSLMRSYLAAGAMVYGAPALDRKFNCTDYFTVLNLENIQESYYKRYIKPWRL